MTVLVEYICVGRMTAREAQSLHGVIVALAISLPFWTLALGMYAGFFA
ncbi:hypothetical protein [Sphingomonas sp. M1A8_2b]